MDLAIAGAGEMAGRLAWCECGCPKTPGDEGCARCMALDEERWAQEADYGRMILAQLRYGPQTWGELANAIGCCARTIRRHIAPLLRSGRVTQSSIEAEGTRPRALFSLAGEDG